MLIMNICNYSSSSQKVNKIEALGITRFNTQQTIGKFC